MVGQSIAAPQRTKMNPIAAPSIAVEGGLKKQFVAGGFHKGRLHIPRTVPPPRMCWREASWSTLISCGFVGPRRGGLSGTGFLSAFELYAVHMSLYSYCKKEAIHNEYADPDQTLITEKFS